MQTVNTSKYSYIQIDIAEHSLLQMIKFCRFNIFDALLRLDCLRSRKKRSGKKLVFCIRSKALYLKSGFSLQIIYVWICTIDNLNKFFFKKNFTKKT